MRGDVLRQEPEERIERWIGFIVTVRPAEQHLSAGTDDVTNPVAQAQRPAPVDAAALIAGGLHCPRPGVQENASIQGLAMLECMKFQ